VKIYILAKISLRGKKRYKGGPPGQKRTFRSPVSSTPEKS